MGILGALLLCNEKRILNRIYSDSGFSLFGPDN